MQEPRGTEAVRQGLGFAESMVRTFEQNAKFYWRMWGPLGEPMIQATEQWANVQRSYIRSLREDPGRIAPVATGDAKVAERSTGAAEGSTAESEEGPGEQIRNAVKESVSRSEEGSGREPQAETTAAPEESSREDIRNIVRESVTRSEEREVPGREAPAATGGPEVAEGGTAESEEGPGEEIRNAVKESVSRSEEGSGREPQAGATAAPEESQGDTEGLPIEEYDSLNVSQVTQRLGELSVEELERLRDYEAENRSRRSLLERFERRIRVAR